VVVAVQSAVTVDVVRGFCAERLSNYKVPETVTLQTLPLPRNANGKVQKPRLRDAAGGGGTTA
jgi:acyl-CoA synthetase (AMP-forming)/AMP-acid ligase II